jgi:hypothetical protein
MNIIDLCRFLSFRHRIATICRENAAIEDATIYYPLLSLLTSHLPLLQPASDEAKEGRSASSSASASKPRLRDRDQLEMIYDLISNYDSHETTTTTIHDSTRNFSSSSRSSSDPSSTSRSRSTLLTAHREFDLSSFKTSLAMHEASPKIQAYYQFYETVVMNSPAGREVARKEEEAAEGCICESWVEWRGKGFCNVEELRRDMEAALGQGAGDSSG